MRSISVCIVDDNKALRDALEEIVGMSNGFKCIGTFATADEAIKNLQLLRPDVVLMDINLEGAESGIDCVRILKPRIPDTNFMMCTVYDEDEKIFEALSSGASGYILKKTTPSKMLDAIRELNEGGAPMSSQIARKVVAAFANRTMQKQEESSEVSGLTNREKEILQLLSKGMMHKEIANALYLSYETIRKHVYNIYNKLHVNNRVEAINKYLGRY